MAKVSILREYNKLVWILVAILIFTFGISLATIGEFIELNTKLDASLKAIGGSLLASIIVFVLVTVFIEPAKARLQAEEIADYAIDVANMRFQERFESNLPKATFAASSVPKRDFQECFAELVSRSSRYEYKGGIGDFTAFRLFEQCRRREFQSLDGIRLSFVDPRSDRALVALAERSGLAKSEVTGFVDSLRNRLYFSLSALYDVGDNISTSVYFHRELPSFRCELFDDGMFLTYYLGSSEYQETIQYQSNTRQYRAYKTSLDLSRRYSPKVIEFGKQSPSENLIYDEEMLKRTLEELGCQSDLKQIRKDRDAHYKKLRKHLTDGQLDLSTAF